MIKLQSRVAYKVSLIGFADGGTVTHKEGDYVRVHWDNKLMPSAWINVTDLKEIN